MYSTSKSQSKESLSLPSYAEYSSGSESTRSSENGAQADGVDIGKYYSHFKSGIILEKNKKLLTSTLSMSNYTHGRFHSQHQRHQMQDALDETKRLQLVVVLVLVSVKFSQIRLTLTM